MTANTPDPAALRTEYLPAAPFTEDSAAPDWPGQFAAWLADAVAARLTEPTAMVLATADARGRPSTRTVLLKGYDPEGFVFFTNFTSRKGVELAANPHASLLFPWLPLHRQVVVCGAVRRLPAERGDAYFAARPRGSQLGAWASPQSSVVPNRAALARAYEAAAQRFGAGPVPRPPHWGGYLLRPESVEFWQGQPNRMHDRLCYRRSPGGFERFRLAP